MMAAGCCEVPLKDQLLTRTLRTVVGPGGVAVHEEKQMTQSNLSSLDFAPLEWDTWSKWGALLITYKLSSL